MSLDKAIQIAAQAHEGQLDKGGLPFIGHPLRVMAKLALRGFTGHILEAAILHDVLEDTTVTEADLDFAGIGFDTIALVKLLTRTPDYTYAEYIQRISDSESNAIDIKLADIEDNMDPARSIGRSDLLDRYEKAVHVLSQRD